jgi:PAS domain S-box-containing protein
MTPPGLEDQVAEAGTRPLAVAPRVRAFVLGPWGFAVLSIVVAIAIRLAVDPQLGNQLPYVSFFVAVTVTAYLATPGATVLAILLGFLAAVWFFIPPRHTLTVASAADVVGMAAYFVVCGFIAAMSHLTSTAKARALASAAELARRKEQVEAEIAERRRAEAALNESELRYRTLVELAPDAVLVHQAGTIVFVNAAAVRLYGAEIAGQLLGRDILEFVHPEDREATHGRMEIARAGALTPLREFRLFRLDGAEVSAEASGIGIDYQGQRAVQVIIRDLGERRRAQEALRASEARFRELAESVPQLVFELDAAEGVTGYFNQRWSEYTGRPPSGRDERVELIHPDDREGMREAWLEAVRSRSPYERESRFRRHDGAYRWFLSRALPVFGAGGEVVRWLGTLTDIHDLKLAQEALRDSDRQKNAFLAILSHELRNPLAPIKNSLFILERTSPGGEQAKRAHAVIARQVEQLTRLVDDLLEVTRITRNKIQLQREPLELNALVRGTLEDHRPSFDENEVRLELSTASTPVFVDGDRNRLAQIIGNLLQNAAKFTAPGGRTRVEVSADPATARATLRVADTGAGLAPEMLDRLFQPFMQADTTLDRSKGGLGLGLALVKGLVELHGGEVRAHSDGVGRGAEFVVHLPLAPGRPLVATLPASVSPARLRRVLVIEDNVDAANSLRESLELSGHQVAVAHSGPQGIDRARELRPEVVLCDIGLPGMDGYGVARALRSDPVLRSTFLVAVSGYALAEDLQRAYAAGFERHLSKPVSLDVLEQVLADVPTGDVRRDRAVAAE